MTTDYGADPIAAAVALLLTRASVTALAGVHIYGEELPDEAAFVASMPRYAIALQSAGGRGEGDETYLALGGQRIDVDCYAPSLFAARRLARTTHAELKRVRRELVTYDDEDGNATQVLIHGFTVSSGYVALREPESDWPRIIRTYMLRYAEQELQELSP